MKIRMFLCFLCISGNTFAQQEPQFTMYWMNRSLYNPAVTGLEYKHFASVFGRNQWVGFPGAPVTMTAIYNYKWEKINSGIGMNYVYDHLGPLTNNKINLNYSYHINLKKERFLSGGLSMGIHRINIEGTLLDPADPNDPALPKSFLIDSKLNVNTGIIFKTPKIYMGLSVTQFNEAEFFNSTARNIRLFYFDCSYNISFGDDLDIKPGILIKGDKYFSIRDLNIFFTLKKLYWFGLTHREGESIDFMVGIDFKEKLRIGYAYDYVTNELSKHTSGSHEIVFALLLKSE